MQSTSAWPNNVQKSSSKTLEYKNTASAVGYVSLYPVMQDKEQPFQTKIFALVVIIMAELSQYIFIRGHDSSQ